MKNKKLMLGMDVWQLSIDLDHFLRLAYQHGWSVYEVVTKSKGRISFCAPIQYHHDILRTFEQITYIKTTGMLGFAFRQLRRPRRIACLLLTLLLWYGLAHTVFEISLYGDSEETKALIQTTLTDMGYTTPFYHQDMQELKDKVKKQLENKIAWIEVSQQGSQYQIQFTTKDFAHIETLGHEELIAQKDGVIARFDLQHGSKMVAINDFVHKGDVLVSNILVDSKNVNKEVYVKGKVYAYTWKDVHVEMDANELPQPFQYFQLLLEARREASKDLQKGESIAKENILQFQDNTGTISMDIHYTLYEDITTPS